MSKYFIAKSTGVVLGVPEDVKVAKKPLVDQYAKHPEAYTPCDKDGKPLKAAKEQTPEGDAPETTAKDKTAAK